MIDSLLKNADPVIAAALDRALGGKDISTDDAVALFDSIGLEMNLTMMVADELRRRTVGDNVTYVVNRNINFTNVCIKQCGFCALAETFGKRKATSCPQRK